MKKHYNKELDASNVYEISVDLKVIDEVKDFYEKNFLEEISYGRNAVIGARFFDLGDPDGEEHFSVVDPGWSGDIKWISPNNLKTYEKWAEYFYKFDLHNIFDERIDYKNNIVLFQTFIVTRSIQSGYNWHEDWVVGGEVNGFTFMSPLSDMNTEQSMHLAYKDEGGNKRTYKYERGKAVVFGEEFKHSTEIGRCPAQEFFLCFSFGSDKEEYEEILNQTGARQSKRFMSPREGFTLTPLGKEICSDSSVG